MAKLSARGRTELARVSKTIDLRGNPNPNLNVDLRKTTYALMSDGTLLKKMDVHFVPVPNSFSSEGENYSYGWKVEHKTKATKEEFLARMTAIGYTQV